MTIRHTLLVSYLLISLVSALFITIMTFVHFREILRVEIENKFKSQATTIMQQIDTALFERFENIALWSQLEIMQEIKVRDVDKRLSHFLKELHNGYGGIYQKIFVVDQRNEIIAASNANMIGSLYPLIDPSSWTNHKNQLQSLHFLDEIHNTMYVSIPIRNTFTNGQLGRLYTGFDWKEIDKFLDSQLPFSSSQDSQSYALLMDYQGRIIATSSALKNQPVKFEQISTILPLMTDTNGSLNVNADIFNQENVLVGYALSQGYRSFQGFGWRVLILQPSKNALAPVWNLWIVILILFALTLLLGIIVSIWMSSKIAGPIVKLAEFTHDFMQGKQVVPPHFKSSNEINALSNQFSQMIDNLEQSKQDLIQASKLAVIGEMAATMAHEVRTPLGILVSSAQILQREPQLSEIGQEMTEFILSETERLKGLINTLLECAKPKQPEFVIHDLHHIIEHVTQLLIHQIETKNITLVLQLNAGQSLLKVDRDLIIQVFLNLIINAIQHVKKEQGYIEISSDTQGEVLEILISDNGTGISDTNKTKIFEPFFTQRQDGVGLGLTVVRQIILAHHGKIYVTDSPFGGACFHIILPYAPL